MHQPLPRQHRNTETQKPRTTTTIVASISVTLEPDDNWTVIPVREQDDLPAHVKSSSLGRGAIWSTEPQNRPPSYKCNISGTLRAVEFINDAWYPLAYSALYGAYRTRARDCAPRPRPLICSTEPTRTTPDHSATATKPYSTTTPNVSHQRHHRGGQ